MSLKTPSFWYRAEDDPVSVRETLLKPLSGVYQFFHSLHQTSAAPYKSMLPVLCIGNVVAGGTGKTPCAIALMKLIQKAGIAKNPYFLIRGYGGGEIGPLPVDATKHNAWDVGDEALILAQHAPTIIGGDRAKSAQLAERMGADFLLMDDGLQNPTLHKDLKLVVINGEMGFGNKKMMPAGPLRQPLERGLEHADGFIFIGNDDRNSKAVLPADKPVFHANLHASDDSHLDETKTYLAFAGLGYPDKFFSFLKDKTNLNVVETQSFSDHHPYDEIDMKILQNHANGLNAELITTRKDAMRIPQIEDLKIHVMPVQMRFENEDRLLKAIQSIHE